MKLVFLFVVVACLALASESEQYETGMKKPVCFESVCVSRCATLGRGRGACVDGRCKCEKEQPSYVNEPIESEDLMEDEIEEQMAAKCIPHLCHWECAKLKAKRGLCVEDQCFCSNV